MSVNTVLTVLLVILGGFMTFLIMLQEGKGGGLAALGGTKAAGIEGVTNPIRRATGWLAGVFFLLAIILGIVNKPSQSPDFITESKEATATKTAPTVDETGPQVQLSPNIPKPEMNVIPKAIPASNTTTVPAPVTPPIKAIDKTPDAAKPDATKPDATKPDPTKPDAVKPDAPKADAPKIEPAKDANKPAVPPADPKNSEILKPNATNAPVDKPPEKK